MNYLRVQIRRQVRKKDNNNTEIAEKESAVETKNQ